MRDVVWAFFKLGWLAFGGPVAQVGLMHREVVERKRWLSEEEFVQALNFCHVLPGPEALQLGIYLGWRRRGVGGGIVAGLLFLLPGFVTLTLLAWVYTRWGASPRLLAVLWVLRIVGLVLLLLALRRIARATLKSVFAVLLAAAAFAAFVFGHVPFIPILLGCGLIMLGRARLTAGAAAVLLLLAPAGADAAENATRRLIDVSWFFLKVGLVSFGGAYAVLPYIREGAVLAHHWLSDHQMIDALALGETTPGPLISIGIFVGYLAGHAAGVGLAAAVATTFFLFLPSFVFVLGLARHMDWLTSRPGVKDFLRGVTSGVVGLMFAVSIPLASAALTPPGGW